MRNLKRALSLALASVMLLGMMVVGTSASYADVTSKQNKEAIEVAQAVGVMVGDDKGNFNPDAKVTRVEMAVVMSNLLNLKVSDFKAAKTEFTDVPAWAAPYVAACKADGIIAGYSATYFGANDTVTAAQAALMVMKALGYFQYAADFGDSWQLATVKQASKIDLYDGISANATTALTRNDVAQLVLNALEATMVEPDGNGGTTIKGDGFEITTGSTKYVDVVKKQAAKWDAIDNDTDGDDKSIVQLGEDLFDGKLVKAPDSDKLGRPANKWTYKSEKIGTYGKEADKVYTLTKKYDDALLDLLKSDDFMDNNKLTFTTLANSAKNVYVNGEGVAADDAKVTNALKNTAKGGTVVEVFEGDKDNTIDYVVVLNYSIAQIDDISTKLTNKQKDDGATCKVKLTEGTKTYITDDKFAGFDSKTYVEDAYILFIEKDKEIVASQAADSITGTVSTLKGDDVRINGSYYTNASAKTIAIDDEGTFYLGVSGMIADVDVTSKSSDYAYIYNVTGKLDTNSDGVADVATFTAYYVTTDGVKGSAVIDATKGDNDTYYLDSAKTKELGKVENEDAKVTFKKGVIAYSINSDKELVYKAAKDVMPTAAADMTVDKNNANGTDSSTKFIFVKTKDNKVTTSVATGYKNVSFEGTGNTWSVKNTDDDYLYVFVADNKGNEYSTSAKYAVILDDEAAQGKDGDDDTFTYDVAIDGEETTLTFDKAQDFEKGQVIAYEMGSKYAKIKEGKTNEIESVYSATKDYIKFANTGDSKLTKQYNLGKKEVIYTITFEYKDVVLEDGTEFDPDANAAKLDTVTVSEGGKVENGDKVVFTLDGSNLDIVFVYDYVY